MTSLELHCTINLTGVLVTSLELLCAINLTGVLVTHHGMPIIAGVDVCVLLPMMEL